MSIVQENQSFVWTHKITMSYEYGWSKIEQERIISRILELFPCCNFNFIEKYKTRCKSNDAEAKIKVQKTATQKAKAKIYLVKEENILGTGTVSPAVLIPPILANGNIALGPQILASGQISHLKIMYNSTGKADAKVVYSKEKVIGLNSRIVRGEYVVNEVQDTPKIGDLRGCSLEGDLSLTGWRFLRDGPVEHIIRYERGVKIDRWIPRVTQIEIWFNPKEGDDGNLMLEAITNLMSYYYAGNRVVNYISFTQFKLEGDYTKQLHKNVSLEINSPEFCCNVFNDEIQKSAYWVWLLDQYPYQIALSRIIEGFSLEEKLRLNARINNDFQHVVVVDSTFDGTYTIVNVEGDTLKDSKCMILKWRESYDDIVMQKSYYPYSGNARIQSYLRSTGKIFYLLGPPTSPGNEEDYAYLILNVGE